MRGLAVACCFALVGLAAPARAEDGPPSGPRPASPPLPPPSRANPGAPATPSRASEVPRPGLAMPSDYRLSPGDEVEIEVMLPPEVEKETPNPFREGRRFVVGQRGVLNVPGVRDVALAGRTLAEVEGDVSSRLKTAGVAAKVDVFVRVVSYAPRFVYLVGATYAKLEIPPFGRANLLQVLAQAGDAMKDVDVQALRVVTPGNGSIRLVNFREVLRAGGTGNDAYLDAGDVVILERAQKVEPVVPVVYIGGQVKEPGVFKLQDVSRAERPTTVTRLLISAKGATDIGDVTRVVIRRSAEGQPPVFAVNLKAILAGQQPDVPLMPDDIVIVPEAGLFR